MDSLNDLIWGDEDNGLDPQWMPDDDMYPVCMVVISCDSMIAKPCEPGTTVGLYTAKGC